MEELNWIIERAIDEAFTRDKYLLNFYNYLKSQNTKGREVTDFLQNDCNNINDLICELNDYISGGNKILLEAYRHVGKTKARKIVNYLEKIIQDAKNYEHEKKPGRKKGSKNKRRKTIHK